MTDWFARRTSRADDWPTSPQRQPGTRVAVVLPALDEAATVGTIVRSIRQHLMGPGGIVDELIVVDSGSRDRTRAVATAAGARVVSREDVVAAVPVVPGKGEALWRGLASTDAEIIVYLDADLQSFTPSYVTGLLGPLLADPQVQLVKAAYERPLVDGATTIAGGGGRVTELVARPLLSLHWPELSGVIQPLAGEYAARRSLLSRLAFPCGWGVEFALLVDTLALAGLDAIAQVDLGVRVHRHHDDRRLAIMAAEIWQVALTRLAREGRAGIGAGGPAAAITRFDRLGEGFVRTESAVSMLERPPLASLHLH